MVGKSVRKVIGLVVAIGLPSMVVADGLNTVVKKEVIPPARAESKLTLRGGYGSSNSAYPYAVSNNKVYEADYGSGLYGYAAYSNSRMFGKLGGEISVSTQKLSNDESTPNTTCGVFDAISLSRRECGDYVATSSATRFNQFRVLATRENSNSGLQFLGGLGVLDLSSSITGRANNVEDNFSQFERTTDYTGLGLVAGARKAIPVGTKALLQLEGFAGVYTGDRELNINDEFSSDAGFEVGKLSNSEKQTVYSLDLAASVAVPADRVLPGSMFEFSVAYTRLFGVMHTSNYNETGAPRPAGFFNIGSVDDDIDALSMFFGVQIPL